MVSDTQAAAVSAPLAEESQLGLTGERESPRLVRRMPALRRLWRNPVFRRNYARSRIKKVVDNRSGFLIGVGYSLTVNLCLLILRDPPLAASAGVVLSLLLPLGALFLLLYVRMFILCLTTTPVELRRNVSESELSPVFTTPLTDQQIYYGECLPNFVKGLEVIEMLVYVALGLLIPYFFAIGLPYLLSYDVEWIGLVETAGATILGGFFLMAGLVLMMLILSLASGLYAISMPAFNAILVTLLHYFIVTGLAYGISGLFGLFSVDAFLWGPGDFQNDLALLFVSQFVKTGMVALCCHLTALMGIAAFTKVRRPGYFEPEQSTAVGLED